ncbi:MAG: ATP-binding protein [Actinobacteria bacterium]|nr:ATP-binding protein [Actinomycetota bacterium]
MTDEPITDQTEDRVIGRASATERQANSADKFHFWLRPHEQVNPFDIVDAEHLDESHTYGLVTDIHHSTDAPAHLSNYIANDFGELVDDPNTPRQGANVCEVSVMANSGENYMPVQTESLVRFADEDGIHRGLGIEIMKQKEDEGNRPVRVPAGLIQMSNGVTAVAHLDIDYLVGPEAAHVNVAGISGLATKTSYAMFLLQSLRQVLARAAHAQGAPPDVAVILVNVKHNDLLQIHEEAERYPDGDLAMWDAMGLLAQPFRDVQYLLPAGKVTQRSIDTPNSYEPYPPLGAYKIYAYGLRDAYSRLPNLLADVPDEYGVLDAIMGELIEGLDRAKRGQGDWTDVHTWNDLLWKSPLRKWIEGDAHAPGALQQRSLLRFVRYLNRLIRDRNSGLLVEKREQRWVTIEDEMRAIEGGKTYVVDIARLQDHEQALVFGDIVRTVYDVMASGSQDDFDLTGLEDAPSDNAPKKVILFVDELNKFAPTGGRDAPLLLDLIEIAERGRSLGIILISAQQFSSAVHSRVIGNSATRVFGRTAPTELSQAAYRDLAEGVRGHLARLGKGELILTHPLYRQPVKIRFPRPAYRQPGT